MLVEKVNKGANSDDEEPDDQSLNTENANEQNNLMLPFYWRT